MPAIVKELTIAVAPESVFNALTKPDEIGGWWTNDLNATPEVGSLAEFRFGEWGDSVLRFEVAELDAGKKVHWIHRRSPVAQWAGLSATGPGSSSLMMGSPRLMRHMNRHAGIGNTSWPA